MYIDYNKPDPELGISTLYATYLHTKVKWGDSILVRQVLGTPEEQNLCCIPLAMAVRVTE